MLLNIVQGLPELYQQLAPYVGQNVVTILAVWAIFEQRTKMISKKNGNGKLLAAVEAMGADLKIAVGHLQTIKDRQTKILGGVNSIPDKTALKILQGGRDG